MNINTATLLSFLEPKLTTGVKDKILALSSDGKTNLNAVFSDKSLQKLLNDLLKDLMSGLKNKSNVNELLKNSKSMMNLSNVADDIKDILSNIKDNPKLANQASQLNKFLLNISKLDQQSLKSNILNSGIHLESKLNKNDENVSSDLKAILLQVSEHSDNPKVQKVLTQIDYHQLMSYTSYSNNTFLPFMWDNIEDGNINISSNKDEQFTCNIDLKLKQYGELKGYILLDKDNLNITIRVKDDTFKKKIQDNLQILRQKINKLSLNVQSLNVLSIVNEKDKSYEEKSYDSSNKLSYGLDIKA